MGQLLLGLVVGLVVGALSAVAIMSLRSRADAEQRAANTVALAASEARAKELEATIERERAHHEQALAALSDRFKVLADETLEGVVERFNASQVQAIEQREHRLDERLDPLSTLLREYKAKVEELETNREKGFLNVQNAASQLLDAQRSVMDETKKLNTILGRSSARGRWGEIQLQRILEISGMTKYVDFDPQFTVKNQSDARLRPDVVVHLPNGSDIAIDAKVPFDAFDRAMATDSEAERDQAMKEYSASMRQHITELRKREYWSALGNAPAFVVCFVPSDHLLSAAFDVDHSLLEDALNQHVLVAGPTTLLGLLWATHMGWSQFETVANIEEIRDLAVLLVDRASVVAERVNKLGRSLNSTTQDFGALVGSLEDRMLVTVREIQKKGIQQRKEIDVVETTVQLTRPLNPQRWPMPLDEIVAIDAELVEVTGDEPDAPFEP